LYPIDELNKIAADPSTKILKLTPEIATQPLGIATEVPTPSALTTPLPVGAETEGNEPWRRGLNVLTLPDQSPMMPGSLQPHLKINRRFDRVEPALLSPEQQIQEANRSQIATSEQLKNVPGAQSAAALIGLTANTQDNMNKVITETNKINSQIITQADARNAQTQALEENAAAQDALSYEQRQLRAKALTDNDINNYYNTLRENNVRNYNEVNNINAANALAEHYQFTGQGYEQVDNPVFQAYQQPMQLTPEQIKAQAEAEIKAAKKANKLRNGGRFKK